MKKFITLLFAVLATTFIFAQSRTTDEAKAIIRGDRDEVYDSDRDNDRYGNDDRRDNDRNHNYAAYYKRKAFFINRYYDDKIRDVRNSHRLSRREKNRILDRLEDQRRKELSDLRRHIAWSQAKNRRNNDRDNDWNDYKYNRRY